MRVDPRYYRPSEVQSLLGDPTKPHEKLGWQARITFPELVSEMLRENLDHAMRLHLLRREGFVVRQRRE